MDKQTNKHQMDNELIISSLEAVAFLVDFLLFVSGWQYIVFIQLVS